MRFGLDVLDRFLDKLDRFIPSWKSFKNPMTREIKIFIRRHGESEKLFLGRKSVPNLPNFCLDRFSDVVFECLRLRVTIFGF